MKLGKCFEVLEISPGCSLEEVKQAYRDAVSVWHPDRFSGNPRLKAKAEAKLKEINTAYETIMANWSRLKGEGSQEALKTDSKAEAIAETTTRVVLHACHFLYNSLKKLKD